MQRSPPRLRGSPTILLRALHLLYLCSISHFPCIFLVGRITMHGKREKIRHKRFALGT